jgi:hypothetical protein
VQANGRGREYWDGFEVVKSSLSVDDMVSGERCTCAIANWQLEKSASVADRPSFGKSRGCSHVNVDE